MKKYLWIGINLDDDLINYYAQDNINTLSALKSQSLIFEGLEHEGDFIFDSINGYRLPYFPKYKKIFIKRHEWSHEKGSSDINIGYCNLPYIAHFFKCIAFINEAKKYVKKNKYNEIIIYVYSIHTPFLKCAQYIKNHCNNVKIILIVPDLPQYMDSNMSKIKKKFKKIDWKIILKILSIINKFVLYSEHMAEIIKINKERYMVMEGCIKKDIFKDIKVEKRNQDFNVVYMGALNNNFGIDKLINTFKLINNKKIKLKFYGNGDAAKYIVDNSTSNISYEGYLTNYKDVLSIEKNSDLLINIRDPQNLNLLKYSFPSKLFEYIYSGVPVLTMRAEGIPKEYDNYLYFYDNLSFEEISKILNKIISLNEKEHYYKSQNNIKFIELNKLQMHQCKRIIDFTLN